jgi:hypothetical protein
MIDMTQTCLERRLRRSSLAVELEVGPTDVRMGERSLCGVNC